MLLLKRMLFSRKMIIHIFVTLILGGLHVAISCVLGMFYEFRVFSQVRFQCIPFNISMEKSCAFVEPKAQQHRNPCANMIILVFVCFSIVRNLATNENFMTFQIPHGVTHKGISVISIKI